MLSAVFQGIRDYTVPTPPQSVNVFMMIFIGHLRKSVKRETTVILLMRDNDKCVSVVVWPWVTINGMKLMVLVLSVYTILFAAGSTQH